MLSQKITGHPGQAEVFGANLYFRASDLLLRRIFMVERGIYYIAFLLVEALVFLFVSRGFPSLFIVKRLPGGSVGIPTHCGV